jgi:hypothetical protein
MAYNITLTNGSLYAVIADGTLNNNSSMTLIGQNYVGQYGEFQNDNFIRLLESNADTTAPGAPLVGQLWYNTATRVLQVYNGTAFKPLGGANASATAPTNNTIGDLWYNTTQNNLSAWSGSGWILIGPTSSAGTGAVASTVIDTFLIPHQVVQLITAGNIVAMVSQDAPFTPQNAIPGFTTIVPGVSLPLTLATGQTPLFTGTATNAQQLGGLSPASYMSSITNTGTTGTLSVLNNTGLRVGLNSEFTASVAANAVSLQNTALNGNINITTNKGGIQTSAIFINGATGAVTLSGNLFVNGTTTTVNEEIINTSSVVAGNVTAGNIISNSSVVAQTAVLAQTLSASGNITAAAGNITTIRGTTGNITTVNATTLNATTLNATTAFANIVATTANAVQFNTATWTIQEFGGKLYFQSGGVNIASLSASGDFITTGDVTAFGTP